MHSRLSPRSSSIPATRSTPLVPCHPFGLPPPLRLQVLASFFFFLLLLLSSNSYGFVANSVVSRTIGPISYSPSPARQTSLSLRTTNMPPNGRPATEAPPRRPQVDPKVYFFLFGTNIVAQPKTLASDVESVSARPQEALNEKAVTVMNRISNKLTGKDFGPQPIDVPTQVQRYALLQ